MTGENIGMALAGLCILALAALVVGVIVTIIT